MYVVVNRDGYFIIRPAAIETASWLFLRLRWGKLRSLMIVSRHFRIGFERRDDGRQILRTNYPIHRPLTKGLRSAKSDMGTLRMLNGGVL